MIAAVPGLGMVCVVMGMVMVMVLVMKAGMRVLAVSMLAA